MEAEELNGTPIRRFWQRLRMAWRASKKQRSAERHFPPDVRRRAPRERPFVMF